MSESTDPLAQAIELSLEFETLRGTKTVEEFLREHESLRDILEPLLEPDTTPDRTQILGDFELRRELGRGGMGVVYEALQIPLGRIVALKLLPAHRAMSPRALAMFRREATLAASLDHPGICKVLQSQEVEGQLAMAMELIDGVPLDTVLAPFEGRQPAELTVTDLLRTAKIDVEDETTLGSFSGSYVESAVELARQVAEALGHAHSRGIVHRDVKPGNILITPQGRAVLTDFGLAREEGMPGMTRTGEFAGTYPYAAPEQLEGRIHEIDGRTDIYALGATLFELITLRRPHEADSMAELLLRIKREEPTRPTHYNPRISADLESVVLCALEKDRHRRYANAHEFATDLQHVLLNTPVRARRLSTSIRATRWVHRNRMVSAFVLAQVLALILVSVFWVQTAEAEAEERLAKDQERVAKVEERVAKERWENIWVGALIDTLVERSKTAIPTWPDQVEELRKLIHVIETDLLTRRREHLAALEHLRTGQMLEQAADRSNERPRHPAADPIFRLQGSIRQLTMEFRQLPSSHPVHQATLAEIAGMREEVEELTKLVDSSNRVQIQNRKDSALHDRLEEQLYRLRRLEAVLLPDLRFRLDWAQRVEDETITQPQKLWNAACKRVAADDRFGGKKLTPQMGLVPIGKDPDSGLEEFGHPLSGVVPVRGQDGKLKIGVEHSVVFVLMPGGDFTSPKKKLGYYSVRFDPFFIGKYEMSRDQWERLAQGLPGLRWRDGGIADVRNHGQMFKPINGISWTMCRKLLDRYGLDLPTAAQWEYTGIFGGGIAAGQLVNFSNRMDQTYARARRVNPAACVNYADGYVGLAQIATMAATPAGLHHMHGNVAEWCRDPYLQRRTPPRDGDGLRVTAFTLYIQRVICGGDFASTVLPLLLYDRRSPNSSYRSIGLRPSRRLL